jgi:hypothetical protein
VLTRFPGRTGKAMANTYGADPHSGYRRAQRWPDPDMSVLRLHPRPAPALPLEVFGPPWADWILATAKAAACPVDYVAAPLLASASVLIGHARWACATPGWGEPPHLWVAAVGESGDGKSPGADCLMRDVLSETERGMLTDFPDRLDEWRAAAEHQLSAEERWKSEVRNAEKRGLEPPAAPKSALPREPRPPCLRQYDVTLEKVEEVLATAAPKGLLIVRDELMGWIDGMTAYNDGARAFWVEAYGGRPYRVERKKFPVPLVIPRLAVGVYGGTQPDKVAKLIRADDDGLLARFVWAWPEAIDFRLGQQAPGVQWAIDAFDRLCELDLHRDGEESKPIMVPLVVEATRMIEQFGQDMQRRRDFAGGLLRSAYGKARGQVLRLSLVLEYLWWCGTQGFAGPPTYVSERALAAAVFVFQEYFAPMAERVYGDAALSRQDRNATTLARWIARDHPSEVHVRQLQRVVRLPDLTTAEVIQSAASALIEAGWLREPPPGPGYALGSRRQSYPVNPKLIKR